MRIILNRISAYSAVDSKMALEFPSSNYLLFDVERKTRLAIGSLEML